ncbi:MAG: hypothetical protein J6X78_01940 [Treponema sp.]|nr:hypothetical protein [Treponema sp.]
MKRFISLLMLLLSFSAFLFGQDYADEDENSTLDEVYVYDSNGAGDQFLKIQLGPIFPLNFKKQLKTGGDATIGYYKFLSKNFAVGGELTVTYNVTIGEKVLIMFPLTFGAMFQPYIGRFEFPLYAEIGIANETWQNMEIFPTLTTRLSAGAYYRITDAISIGLSTDFLWIPQWFKDSSKNFNGLFETATIGLRYHF